MGLNNTWLPKRGKGIPANYTMSFKSKNGIDFLSKFGLVTQNSNLLHSKET